MPLPYSWKSLLTNVLPGCPSIAVRLKERAAHFRSIPHRFRDTREGVQKQIGQNDLFHGKRILARQQIVNQAEWLFYSRTSLIDSKFAIMCVDIPVSCNTFSMLQAIIRGQLFGRPSLLNGTFEMLTAAFKSSSRLFPALRQSP
jgi:hypothetical protein